MNEVLTRRFAAMGARLEIHGTPLGMPSIDVVSDTFVIRYRGSGGRVEVEVIALDRPGHHLLVLVRDGDVKSKFLCGHDERHWFVAAVPEAARGVTNVATAKLALQPTIVHDAVRRRRPKDRFRRRNTAYIRQGEWFFVPVPDLEPPAAEVLRNEPLTRGRGKAHVLEQAYRQGGTSEWVNASGGRMNDPQFQKLKPNGGRGWRRMILDPELYATGAVRHPDHATIVLRGWHRVVMNTEQGARAMAHVAFLD